MPLDPAERTPPGPLTASRILVVNAGSSSVKLRLLEADDSLAWSADLATTDGHVDDRDLADALHDAGPCDAVGHRVVHGGTRFLRPAVIDDATVIALEELIPLAPLHQPIAVELIRAVQGVLPDTSSVACFDTAFHATLPAAAATFAVPQAWREELGVRRYGFHGLAHAWAARRGTELVGRPIEELRIVTCHLGAGASLAAVRGGVSIDTTMGFTPLDGLVMATRSGSLDPGLVLWLTTQAGLSPTEVEDALHHSSGVKALAGTADLKDIIARATAIDGDPTAQLALDVYVHRLRASIASMAAAMNGLDMVVFSGGVGEHSAVVRARAAHGLGFLGVHIDAATNDAVEGDADITAADAPVRTLVVTAREDLEIARLTRDALD